MGSEHHNHHDRKSNDECTHSMLFHAGHCEKILWKSWYAQSILEFTLSAVAVFFIAFLYEGLKFVRQVLLRRELEQAAKAKQQTDPVCSTIAGLRRKQILKQVIARPHLIQTVLYLCQVTMSMLLMLTFMTFNYWLCLAIILGLTLGYFIFGWIKDDAYDSDCCQ
ncbi:high affinity copper uptake protein 1-like [Eurosta solidaginis]|uniref:high affinity copper uptake protein 1-like n=1 Tax=Eurosta solidaginis TaxID=178769 RepID=UPI00353121DC